MQEIRKNRGDVFRIKKPYVKEIIALRVSLYDTTLMTELRKITKERGAAENLKAIEEREYSHIKTEIEALTGRYGQFSRNKRKALLRYYSAMQD